MKTRKLVSIFAALMLLAGVLAGCSKSGGSAQGAKSKGRTVTWMTVRDNHAEWGWDMLAAEYEKDHPGFKVEFEGISDRTSYYQRLKILAANNELPDIFDCEGDALGAEIAATGVMKDIDELYKEIGYDRMMPIGLNYARLPNGKLYHLAWENNVEYIWYHKELFAKAGIARPPETFDELLEDCQKLKAAGIAPIAVWGDTSWPMLRWMSFIPFRLTGNDYIENLKTGKAKMSDPVGMQAVNFFQKAAQYFQPGWATADSNGALDSFLSGSAAIYFIGSWQNGSFIGPDRELKEDYAFFYMPTLPGAINGRTDMVAHAGTGTAIRKDKCDDQLKDFLKFFLDKYPETYFGRRQAFPPMTFDTGKANLSRFQQQVFDDCNALTTAAYTWDVRLDIATNEVFGKELVNLGLGAITPQEFAKRIDTSIANNAVK
jgi:raffinose/stachyose/melibiose transport system substrate-binding protein